MWLLAASQSAEKVVEVQNFQSNSLLLGDLIPLVFETTPALNPARHRRPKTEPDGLPEDCDCFSGRVFRDQ